MDRSGTQVGGWHLVALLGRGGLGEVYRARRNGEPDRALKLLLAGSDREQDRRRFGREAVNMARVEHPALVPCLEAGVAAGLPYLVMELVEGGDLAGLIERGERQEPELAIPLVRA